MTRKSNKRIALVCDWCKSRSENFVINALGYTFCTDQKLGEKPLKDCFNDYLIDFKKKHPNQNKSFL